MTLPPSLRPEQPKQTLRSRWRRMRSSSFLPLTSGVLAVLLILAVTVLTYMHLEGWDFFDSFYMAVITLSTVGFQEVHELSKAGRLFTSGVILVGVGSFAFIAGTVAQLLVEGKLQQMLGRHKMQRTIDKLEDHFIVCGYGRIGSIVAREIRHEGLPVVVVESNPGIIAKLEEENTLYVAGDATDDQVLLAAGLERASSVITALTQEAANVYVCLTARQINPKLKIISRADSEGHINRLELAGADRVVLPHMIGGVRMAQSVLRPTVISFLELAVRGGIDLQMEELRVGDDSELVGKDLIESKIRPRFNLIIMAIKKADGEMVFNPAPQAVIEAGDTLLAIGKQESLEDMRRIL